MRKSRWKVDVIRMQIVLTILLMITIGAIIGGFTNYLAIKMLFRPYKTLYIGRWRVPFTPGLIPKRRDELAEQMGKMVVNHLLTPESIQRKFLNENFHKEMTGVVQRELETFLNTEKTPAELLDTLGIKDVQAKTERHLDDVIERKYEDLMRKYRNQPLKEIIPENLLEKVNEKIPNISKFILQKGVDYFSSIEGNMRIQRMADDFLKERSGVLGGMMQMFMGNINIADKIQPEIIKFLKNEGTADMITTLVQKEWEKVLNWEGEKLEEQFNKADILSFMRENIRKIIRLEQILKSPISKLSEPYRVGIIETIVPRGVELFGEWLSSRVDVLMERLRLQEIIRDQVEAFSVERLEEMVLSIINSELKMITFLGALLGGMIGLFQGIIAIVL
ncbi:DUF445 family protein [Bacillus sp. DTU_2020_1000418_1_SI_GHA_SEK_038]|uniref:DUF445 domain-containing protein n=1 Tax=Bacillus sp. DTU_2020_1000418_1_SI_GHA_SEK_038 TaxID=3077585 RepID=UPI0028EB7067|nr:DUF445 family protein [Bacillus sp. DTU_2020_1000418_1_SI_GHA_SEK_038]WNS76746.1 DUF445 family protein [Bacillus sp. DTU_2020_1000418_1_SI_GHA_SEK_038]